MPAFLPLLLIAASPQDSIPARPITQLVHTVWTQKEGAPVGMRTLAQTTDGYIWIGTGGAGLFRFDGARFVRFKPLGTDTLSSRAVGRLLATRDGSLWMIGSSGVVSRLQGGRVRIFTNPDSMPAAFELTESSQGVLVAGTPTGISRFLNGTWEDVTRAWGFPGKESRSVWFDRDDVLWAMTEDRLVYLPAGGRQFLDPGLRLASVPTPMEFAQEKDGTVWVSEVGRSAHTLRKVGDRPDSLTEVRVGATALIIDRKGSLWVTTAGDGLRRVPDVARIRGKQVAQFGPEAEQITMKNGLQSDLPNALLEDREGNVWIAHNNALERFREGAFTPVPLAGPSRSRFVRGAKDSSVWSSPYGLAALQRISLRPGDTTITLPFNILNVAEDFSGGIWIPTGRDVWRFDGKRFVVAHHTRGEISNIQSVAVDPAGTIWAYDDVKGLFRLEGDTLLLAAELLEPIVRRGNLFSDRSGRIWIAQQSRVAMYATGKLTKFEAAEGINRGFVYSVLEDRSGTIWAPSASGLYRFDNGRFRALTDRQGIVGRSAYALAQEDGGAWWVATPAGILRFPPGELEHAFADSGYVARSRLFDERDGMQGVLGKGYWGPVLTRAADGTIWVATDSGVAHVDPRRLPPVVPPPVRIEVARVDDRELAPADTLKIPAGTRTLEIDYTAFHFANPERLRFRYRLEGQSSVWQDVGTRRRAYYTGLGPGSYRFQVTASSDSSTWNDTAAVWSFRVLPHWYQTVWFKGLVVLCIGGVGGAIVALTQRVRQRRAEAALRGRYEATLAERARISQDLHDTLLQGFAGVTLQLKAVENALPERPDVAAETILRVQKLARASLREARERVWDMREVELGSEDLPAALEGFARERTTGAGMEVNVVTTGHRRRLPRPVEDAVFRIGREAIANAVRHAEPRTIEVAVDFGADRLRVEVRDDGKGFTPDQAEDARKKGHFGLSGIRDRAANAGGTCAIAARPGGGTIVTLELPLAGPK